MVHRGTFVAAAVEIAQVGTKQRLCLRAFAVARLVDVRRP
jgi:hypothetical protein